MTIKEAAAAWGITLFILSKIKIAFCKTAVYTVCMRKLETFPIHRKINWEATS